MRLRIQLIISFQFYPSNRGRDRDSFSPNSKPINQVWHQSIIKMTSRSSWEFQEQGLLELNIDEKKIIYKSNAYKQTNKQFILCTNVPLISSMKSEGLPCLSTPMKQPKSLALLRCNSPLNSRNTIHKFCSEKNICIIEHAFFQ